MGVKFRFERLKINSDNCELTAQSFESNLQYFQVTTGKASWRRSCLYIRNGKLVTKWRSRQTKRRKENFKRTRHLNTRFPRVFIACLQEFPFTVVISENVFCQGMVVLLNPVCALLSGMLHVYKSEVHVSVFET